MIDPNVVAALVTGLLAIVAIVVGQIFRIRNAAAPDATPDDGPKSSREMWDHITGLSGDVADLKRALSDEKAARQSFTGAVRRYLELLARSWGHTDTMPDPEGEDFETLQLTLPRPPRRR